MGSSSGRSGTDSTRVVSSRSSTRTIPRQLSTSSAHHPATSRQPPTRTHTTERRSQPTSSRTSTTSVSTASIRSTPSARTLTSSTRTSPSTHTSSSRVTPSPGQSKRGVATNTRVYDPPSRRTPATSTRSTSGAGGWGGDMWGTAASGRGWGGTTKTGGGVINSNATSADNPLCSNSLMAAPHPTPAAARAAARNSRF